MWQRSDHSANSCTAETFFWLCLPVAVLFSSCNARAQDFIDTTKLIFEISLPPTPEPETGSASGIFNDNSISLADSLFLYREEINSIQQSADPYNHALLEQYSGLGDTYQTLGLHEEAITNYESAIQISKIQNGLYNLDQLPLVEKIIQSYVAIGDTENASLKHEYIHYLHLVNYSAADPDMISATLALADWYIASFFKDNFQNYSNEQRLINNIVGSQPRLTSGLVDNNSVFSGGMQNPNSALFESILNGDIKGLNPRDIEDSRLIKVGSMYENLQHDIYATEQPDIATIVGIARRIATLAYITRQEMEYERHNFYFNSRYNNTRQEQYRNSQQRMDRSYESGRNALQFVVNVLRSLEARPGLQAAAMIELADWNIAYGKIAAAKQNYQEAYALMTSDQTPVSVIDLALNSDTPRQIPMLATHFYSRKSAGIPEDTSLNYRGYIDVSYTIDAQGNVSEIDFHETTSDEERILQALIKETLEIAKFRPVIQNGEFLSHGQKNLRYYYAY